MSALASARALQVSALTLQHTISTPRTPALPCAAPPSQSAAARRGLSPRLGWSSASQVVGRFSAPPPAAAASAQAVEKEEATKKEKKEKKKKKDGKAKAKAAKDMAKDIAAEEEEEVEEEEREEDEGGPLLAEQEAEAEAEAEVAGQKEGKKRKPRKIKFVKYQGLGNDFIMIDNRRQEEPLVSPAEAAQLCNRNFGVGGDGVIFLLPPEPGSGAQFGMRIYNSDGSEPEMCGNGIRCLAQFIYAEDEHKGPQQFVASTLAGNMVLHLKEDGQVQVDMGPPTLAAPDIPTALAPSTGEAVVGVPLDVAGDTWSVTCVSMGNPHCISFASAAHPEGFDVDALDLHLIGPQFENHPVFPARTNTEFVQVISRSELKMRVWERGAGPTLACGTGACALVVAAVLEGRADRKCLVHLPGGPLEIEWREEDNRVYMTGPAKAVFEGKVYLP